MRNIMGVAIAWMMLATSAGAQVGDSQNFSIPLSSPGSPAVLEIDLLDGDIRVNGYEGSEIVVDVTFSADDDDHDGHGEHEGLMRLPSVSGGLVIEEDQNRVSIETDWGPDAVSVDVRAPFETSLILSAVNGDLIEAHGVTGQHELSHTNGDIKATGLRGSVVADTTNGDVEIELLDVTAGTPMSFTTFNGDINLRLPADFQAELRMQSGQGDIYTDFDVVTRPTQARVDREEKGNGFRVRIEREVMGTIGAGGPELRFKTVNGDIYLRKIQ